MSKSKDAETRSDPWPWKRERLTLFLFWHEFLSIDEYDCTLPTGTTIGKFWRLRPESLTVGAYYHRDGEHAYIAWFDVVLRYGPAPPGYTPPDWSNFAGWQRQREEERKANAAPSTR